MKRTKTPTSPRECASEPVSGPVQFLPAKSLNEVEDNEEYDSLTSVISTGDGNRQGGFDLDDKRIKYGIFPFWGLVDNHGAESTNLSETDVKRLDSLCWRALKNQTTSRSKTGPRATALRSTGVQT